MIEAIFGGLVVLVVLVVAYSTTILSTIRKSEDDLRQTTALVVKQASRVCPVCRNEYSHDEDCAIYHFVRIRQERDHYRDQVLSQENPDP